MTELERLAGQISIPGVELSLTGAVFTDPNLAFDDFERLLKGAGNLHTAAKWVIGDALNFAEKVFGERYAQAMDVTGLSYSALSGYAYVCDRIATCRRRQNLRFSHHAEVAPLEPAAQDEWLDKTEANGWTVADLRERLREIKPPRRQPSLPATAEGSAPEVLSLDQVDAAEKLAQETLTLTLPSGHPLWETQAKALAQDTLSLAATAKVTLIDALQRAIDEAQPYGEIGFWVTRTTWQELVALVNDEGGTS